MAEFSKCWNSLEAHLLARDFEAAQAGLADFFPDGVPEEQTWDFGQEEAQGNCLVAQGLVQWDAGDLDAAASSFEAAVSVGEGKAYKRGVLLGILVRGDGEIAELVSFYRTAKPYDVMIETQAREAARFYPKAPAALLQKLRGWIAENPGDEEILDAIAGWFGDETSAPEPAPFHGYRADDLAALYDASVPEALESYLDEQTYESIEGIEIAHDVLGEGDVHARPTVDLHDHLTQDERDACGFVVASIGEESAPSGLLYLADDGTIGYFSVESRSRVDSVFESLDAMVSEFSN